MVTEYRSLLGYLCRDLGQKEKEVSFDAQGVKDLLLLVAGLMVIAAGIFIALKAKNGEVRDALNIFFGVLIAALVIALGSHLQEVGNWLFNVIF